MDTETDTVHRLSDTRIVCHRPRLDTHTLTVCIGPGCDPPTLQTSVEQLKHLIFHLNAKVSHGTLPLSMLSLLHPAALELLNIVGLFVFSLPSFFLTFKFSLYNRWNTLCNHRPAD